MVLNVALEDMVHSSEESTLRTARLEVAYEKALGGLSAILFDENLRSLHVRLLLAEYDRDRFRMQADDATILLERAEFMRLTSEAQLNDLQEKLSHLQNLLRDRLHEIERFKVEQESFRVISSDAARLRVENSDLTCEIAALKQEVETLKSHAALYQSVLSEKGELDQQVASLQAELQNTKHYLEHSRLTDFRHDDEEDGQAHVPSEQLSKQPIGKTQNCASVETEVAANPPCGTMVESKDDQHKAQLEAGNKQVQLAPDDCYQQTEAQADAKCVQFADDVATSKRDQSMLLCPDLVIETPGNVNLKKTQRASTLPGAKSSFSITPFLDRTRRRLLEEDLLSEDEMNRDVSHQELTWAKRGKRGKKSDRERGNDATDAGLRPAMKATKHPNRGAADISVPSQSPEAIHDHDYPGPHASPEQCFYTTNRVARAEKSTKGGKKDKSLFDDVLQIDHSRISTTVQSLDVPSRQSEGPRRVRRLGNKATRHVGLNFSPLKRNMSAV